MNEVFAHETWCIFEVTSDWGDCTHVAAETPTDALKAYADDADRAEMFCDYNDEEVSFTLKPMTVKEVEETMVLLDVDAIPSEEVPLGQLFLRRLGEEIALQQAAGYLRAAPFVISSTLP